MTDEVCEVVITAPDADWLAQFTRALVDDRLAASGHNITPIRSIYRWQGQVYDKTEARVALHTRAALVPAIIERTNRDHPYKVPCVIATPIVTSNPRYHRWILDQTSEAA
ncbi:divalent-cation tolerance protein CutA [Rhizomonospora bruguierae]|uniref:divalent-cation tolerance protein CutA n=1 Tax=Rhizomonospora bruguierae TaxID=1581705 RepID=UPI001BCC7B78|nr:divalent-cation tolerance protein CutA [Micromonospora sp. NBRC 107566]